MLAAMVDVESDADWYWTVLMGAGNFNMIRDINNVEVCFAVGDYFIILCT